MNSSASLSSSSMSDDARAKKRKKAKKKNKSRKESGSVFIMEDLDLNKEVFPIGHYMDDRPEMIRQVFNVVKGARLQAMLPPLLKELPMEEIVSKCLEQLKSMSRETVSRVLAGKEGSSPLRPAPIPNSQLPTRLVEHQGASASKVWAGAEESGWDVVKRKSVEKELRTEQSAKKQKMASGEAENEEGKTLMEILEMEMRARAIKAMLRRDKEVETETENPAESSPDPESLMLGTRQVLPAEADENRDQQQVDRWEGGENYVMADWPPAKTAATRKSPQVEPVMQKKASPTREEKRARARAINSAISIKRTLLGEADSTKQNEQDASFIKDKSLAKEGTFEAKKKRSQSDKKKKKDKGKAHKEEDGDRREKKESKKAKEHDGTSAEKILPQVQQRQYRKAERWPRAARKRSSRSHSPGRKTEKNPNQKSSKTRKSRQRNSSISLSASPPIRPVESFQNRHVDSSSAPRRSPLNVGSRRRQEEHGSSFSQDDERDARFRRYSRSPLASRSIPKVRQDVSPRTRRVAKVSGYESILPASSPREVDAGRRKEHDRRTYKSRSSMAVYETDVVAIRNLEDGELATSEEGEIDSSGDEAQSPQGVAGANHDPRMKVSMKIHKSSRIFSLPKRTFGSCNLNPSSEQEIKFQGRETNELEKVSDSEEDFTTDMNLNDLSNGPELPVLNPEYDVSFGDVEDEHSHDKAISLSPPARPNDDTDIPGLVEQNGQLGHHISQEAKLYEDSNVLAHDEGGLDQQPVLGNFGYDSKDLGEEESDPPSIEELSFDWDKKAASKAVGLTSEGHDAEHHLLESNKNEIVSKLRDDHNNEVEELQKIQSRSHVEAQPAHPTELSEIGKDENQQSDVYASDINNSIQVADSSGPETKQVLIEISDKKKDEESTSRSTASVPHQGVIEKTCSLESNSVGVDVTAVVEQRSGQIEGQEDSIPESSVILGENNSSVVAANGEVMTKKNLSTEESIQIEEVAGTEDRIVISETVEGREVLSMSEFKKQQKLKTSDKDDVEDEDCGAVSWSERWYRSHKVKKVVETSRMFGKVRSQLRTKLLDKKGESHMEDSSSGHSSESSMPVEVVNGSLAEYEQLTGKKIVTDEGKQDTLNLTELSVTPPPPPPEEEDSAEEDLWGQILG